MIIGIIKLFSVHKLCSNQNGRCSKFCLPRGENSKKCACNDGEQVDSEGLCPGGMSVVQMTKYPISSPTRDKHWMDGYRIICCKVNLRLIMPNCILRYAEKKNILIRHLYLACNTGIHVNQRTYFDANIHTFSNRCSVSLHHPAGNHSDDLSETSRRSLSVYLWRGLSVGRSLDNSGCLWNQWKVERNQRPL